MKIVGGERHSLGKELIVEIDIPDRLIAGKGDFANRHSKRNFFLDIVAAGRPVRGGAVEPERLLQKYSIKAGHSRINIIKTEPGCRIYGPEPCQPALMPGLYQIRLRADSFVVDQARLLVTVDVLPGSVKLVTDEPLSAGKDFSVVFEAPPLLHRKFDYSIELVRLLKSGRAQRVYWVRHDAGFPSGVPIPFINGVEVGGQYAIRLILSHSDRRRQYYPNRDDNRKRINSRSDYTKNYILDSLVVQIGAVKHAPGEAQFSVTEVDNYANEGRHVVVEGKKIPVVYLRTIQKTDRGPFFARLYRVDEIPKGRHGGYFPSGSLTSDPVKEWPIEMGKKKAWNIDGDLPPGSYILTMPGNRGRYIQILPKFSTIKISLGGKRRFQYAEPIPVSVAFPGNVSPEIKNNRLGLEITKMGGHIPGCAIEHPALYPDAAHRRVIIEPAGQSQPITMQPLDEVGLYLMRLFAYDSGATLDEVAFEVVSEPLPNVISLAGGPRYTYNSIKDWKSHNDPPPIIEARIKLPADHPLAIEHERYAGGRRSNASLVTGFFDHGAIAVGGATSFPSGDMNPYSLKLKAGQGTFKGSMGHPGSYEFRLFHRYTESREILISSAPFTVEDSASPFPLSHGLKSISLRNDLITPNNPWPPVGEYLNGDNCEPETVKPEKMDLRFVRWSDGEYVPVDRPLEFGEAFYIEGGLKEPAIKNSYLARVSSPSGTEEEVALFRTEDDPKIVRSELLYFIWDTPEDANGRAQ